MKKQRSHPMEKAVIYARVSSKDQEAEGFSIPAQIKALQEYAAKNNLIAQEFTDVETAKKAGRKQFGAMLKLIETNKHIKHILVEKTDRLLRNITDWGLLDRLMASSDIKIHFVKENVILSGDSRSNEKFIFGIKALMSKHYSDNLSEEVRKGMTEKAAQGLYPSFAPYGYMNVREADGKKVLKPDPEAAPFVRKMFELYATGTYSLATLRKKMLADGMVYRNGRNFHESKVEGILKNEVYTGIFYWKGKKYENASHEPLISKELYWKVQEILRSPYKSKSRKGLFPYTNMIKCGACGYVLTAEIKKGKYIYYHCTGYKDNCKQPYIKQEVIESTFEELLESIHVTDQIQSFILQGIRESFKDKVTHHNEIVEQLGKRIKTLQIRIDEAYFDKLDRKITEEFWLTHTRKWIDEKENLTIQLLAAQRADANYLEQANIILELANKASQLFKRQNAEQKRRLINLLTSNCYYRDGKLDVELKPIFHEIMKTSKSGNWCARKESNPQPADPKSDALSN